jgi:hypothetical protein
MATTDQKLSERRRVFAEKIIDWGNLVFAGLVIGQLVPGTGEFRFLLLLGGIINFFTSYLVAYMLMGGGELK